MTAFKKVYKKLSAQTQLTVKEAIRAIIKDPKVSREKKGDLAGVWVYKFKVNHQEILLPYEWQAKQRFLLALGVHENFYRDLQRKK